MRLQTGQPPFWGWGWGASRFCNQGKHKYRRKGDQADRLHSKHCVKTTLKTLCEDYTQNTLCEDYTQNTVWRLHSKHSVWRLHSKHSVWRLHSKHYVWRTPCKSPQALTEASGESKRHPSHSVLQEEFSRLATCLQIIPIWSASMQFTSLQECINL